MAIKDFRDLEIWKRGMAIVEEIYSSTRAFPKEELFGLTAQIRKSAVSIPSNIAEGFARSSNREFRQFLFFTLGSCAEATTQLMIASKLKYINENKSQVFIENLNILSKMTMSLIKKLKENKLATSD